MPQSVCRMTSEFPTWLIMPSSVSSGDGQRVCVHVAMRNLSAASPFTQLLTQMAALQMLDAMDSKRVEGIFCGDLSHVPEGQARAMQLLDDSYGACSFRKDCETLYKSAPSWKAAAAHVHP